MNDVNNHPLLHPHPLHVLARHQYKPTSQKDSDGICWPMIVLKGKRKKTVLEKEEVAKCKEDNPFQIRNVKAELEAKP